MEITIDKNFAGLELIDGVYYYSGDLKIDGNASIYENLIICGDLIVVGNLTTHENIKALGSIFVCGDLTAAGNVSADKVIVDDNVSRDIFIYGDLIAEGNVSADKVIVDGNVSINESLDVELFCVFGNITVKGDLKTRRMSSCYGNFNTYNLAIDDRIYVGGNVDIKDKKYKPLKRISMKTFEDIMKEMARRIVRELLLKYDDDDAFEELSRLTRACVVFYSCNEPIEDVELFEDIKDFYEYVKKDNSLYFDNYDDAIAFLKTLTLPIDKCVDIMLDNNYEPDEINTISLANVLAAYKAGECFRTRLPKGKENLAFLVVKILINEFV